MRKLLAFAIIIFAISTLQAQQKTKVLVLGTYHMGNPGLDAFNMQADDVTLPKRQKEIEDFVAMLASFKPTKICLEFGLERQQKLDDLYSAYVSGKAELRRNETDQIGLRLAKKLGHQKVYAIDVSAPFEMDTVVKVAQKYQFNSFLELLQKMPSFMQEEDKKLHESTITQFFQYINSDEYNRMSHGFYLDMAVVGKDNNYAGADLVADWYKRNLRIYRNLMALNFKPEDRVLILYGAGHSKILQDLVEDSSTLQLVKLSELK
jgi:Family of unknown function (DUF5694)